MDARYIGGRVGGGFWYRYPFSFDDNRVSHSEAKLLRRRAVADGDLHQARASEQRQWRARRGIEIGAFESANPLMSHPHGQSRNRTQRIPLNIGGGVSEMIDVDHASGPGGGFG